MKQLTIDIIQKMLLKRITDNQKIIDDFRKKITEGTNWDVVQAIEWRAYEVFEAAEMVSQLLVIDGLFKSCVKEKDLGKFGDGLVSEIKKWSYNFFRGFWEQNNNSPIANIIEQKKYIAYGNLIQFYQDIFEILEEEEGLHFEVIIPRM